MAKNITLKVVALKLETLEAKVNFLIENQEIILELLKEKTIPFLQEN